MNCCLPRMALTDAHLSHEMIKIFEHLIDFTSTVFHVVVISLLVLSRCIFVSVCTNVSLDSTSWNTFDLLVREMITRSDSLKRIHYMASLDQGRAR